MDGLGMIFGFFSALANYVALEIAVRRHQRLAPNPQLKAPDPKRF